MKDLPIILHSRGSRLIALSDMAAALVRFLYEPCHGTSVLGFRKERSADEEGAREVERL